MGTKYKIEVAAPGGLPGYTSGDIIEDPTPEQVDLARRAKGGSLRLHEVTSKGGGVKREVTEDADNPSKASG